MSQPQSICIITDTRAFGGTEVHTLSLMEALVQRGHTIELISCGFHCYDAPVSAAPWGASVGITHAEGSTNDSDARALRGWSKVLESVRSRTVIIPKGDYRSGSVDFLRLCRSRFRQMFAIEHLEAEPLPWVDGPKLFGVIPLGIGMWWYRRTKDRRQAFATFDRVVAVSAAVKNRLGDEWGIPKNKMVVVRNGVRWEEFAFDESRRLAFRDAKGIGTETFVFGMLTRLVPAKAVDVAIKAVAELVKLNPSRDYRLVIAGEGEDRDELDRLVLGLDVAERVQFVGHSDSRTALSAFDVILFSSIREGLPLALLEGMACGAIPIVTAISGMPEAVSDRSLGWVVPANEPDNMALAMAEALKTGGSDWARMRAAVVAKVSTEFDLEASRLRLCEALGL